MITVEKERYTSADCLLAADDSAFLEKALVNTVLVIQRDALPPEHPGQLFFCLGTDDAFSDGRPDGPSDGDTVLAVSLSTGEYCRWRRDQLLGMLKPELLPANAKLFLSQIPPNGASERRAVPPPYAGCCFLADGRYASAVPLNDWQTAMAYLSMQSVYQHRVMIYDRDGLCIVEMEQGQLISPVRRMLEAWRTDFMAPEHDVSEALD